MLALLLLAGLGMSAVALNTMGVDIVPSDDADEDSDDATIDTDRNLVEGTPQDDLIAVADSAEEIDAENHIASTDGKDLILHQGGDDTIDAGKGDDIILGDVALNDAAELIYDTLHGASGVSTSDALNSPSIYGTGALGPADGNDVIDGGNGDDIIIDSYANEYDLDVLYGGAGDDVIIDFDGSTTVEGEGGQDIIMTLDAEGGDDELDGGSGHDVLLFDRNDTATGGSGADAFIVTSDTETTDEVATITDFDASEGDQVVVTIFSYNMTNDSDSTFTETLDIQAREVDGGTMISTPDEGDILMLEGITRDQFLSAHFNYQIGFYYVR